MWLGRSRNIRRLQCKLVASSEVKWIHGWACRWAATHARLCRYLCCVRFTFHTYSCPGMQWTGTSSMNMPWAVSPVTHSCRDMIPSAYFSRHPHHHHIITQPGPGAPSNHRRALQLSCPGLGSCLQKGNARGRPFVSHFFNGNLDFCRVHALNKMSCTPISPCNSSNLSTAKSKHARLSSSHLSNTLQQLKSLICITLQSAPSNGLIERPSKKVGSCETHLCCRQDH